MKTLILPGYSKHNLDWAEETMSDMGLSHDVIIHKWSHWNGNNFSLKREIEKILGEIGKEKINIIAKSVGVYVALTLVPKISDSVNKLIFCGIASVEGEERKDLLKKILSEILAKNILCIQNEKDKFVKFEKALEFYHSVEPKLKVISKPRSDHSYPYSEDFRTFLEK